MSVRSRSLPTRTRVLMHCDCCSCQTEKELRDASLSDTGHVNAKALVSVLLSKACSTVMTRVRTAEGLACRAYRIFNPRSVRSSCFVFFFAVRRRDRAACSRCASFLALVKSSAFWYECLRLYAALFGFPDRFSVVVMSTRLS